MLCASYGFSFARLYVWALGRLCHNIEFASVIVAMPVTIVLSFGMSDAPCRCFMTSLIQVVLFGLNFPA